MNKKIIVRITSEENGTEVVEMSGKDVGYNANNPVFLRIWQGTGVTFLIPWVHVITFKMET